MWKEQVHHCDVEGQGGDTVTGGLFYSGRETPLQGHVIGLEGKGGWMRGETRHGKVYEGTAGQEWRSGEESTILTTKCTE